MCRFIQYCTQLYLRQRNDRGADTPRAASAIVDGSGVVRSALKEAQFRGGEVE